MIEHFALDLCNMYEQLTTNIHGLAGGENRTVDLHPDYKKSMARTGLQRVLEQHKRLDFGSSVILRADMLHQLLMDGRERYTPELLEKELHSIMMEIVLVLSQRKFAYIPPSNAPYFEQEKLFGEEVHSKFEEARLDIKDAGNCFAAGLPTACVFHLMRIAEFGLRSIARKIRVSLKDKGKLQPVEFATWDKVIQGINTKIAASRALPHGPRKNKKLQFYSDAAEQSMYIRDLWRNEVSHTRKRFNENEALGVMGRVRDFMQLLARETP
jgi:hypothetical protein